MEQNETLGVKITVEDINGVMVTLLRNFQLSLTTHHGRSKVKNGSIEVHKNCSFINHKKYIKRN